MKKHLILLLIAIFAANLTFAQTFPPLPGEKPEKIYKFDPKKAHKPGAAVNNWGEDLLLPDAIKARLAAECQYSVVVKVFDTGQRTSHSYLSVGQLPGTNYCQPPGSVEDANGHSTHVCGIIAASEFGLCDALVKAGKVKFKPVKVLNDAGSGNFEWITTAIKTEDIENRAFLNSKTFVVVNMSLGGGTGKVASTEAALKASNELGVIYCVAAGNTGTLGVNYPGNSQYVLGVGSLDQSLKRSSFSTFGPEVWNAEPGSSIYSTFKGNTFATLSGTSMATPFQSALCAIALSKWGAVLSNQVTMKQYMAWVATDITPTGKDDQTGYGYALVKSILDKNPKDMDGGGPIDPVDPPKPPVHAVRNLQFNLNTNLNIIWTVSAGSTPAKVKNTAVSVSDFAGILADNLTITKLEVQVNSTTDFADEAAKKLNTELAWFFTNRGLQLQAGSDYADAAYWAGYFCDLVLKTQRNYDIDLLRLEAKDAKGNAVLFTKENLKKY